MANPSFFTSQKHDYSQGTNWSSSKFLKGDGTWDTSPITTITNTVFVSKGGNDSSGLAERLDKPFLTLAAARTPSSTKRILIVVFPGTYTEQLVLANYVDWDLTNSIIDLQTNAATYTITDNAVACNSVIYGNGQILRSTGAAALGCIDITAASTIRINCDYINATIGAGINLALGTIIINSTRGINGVTGITHTGGTFTINGNLTATTTGINSNFTTDSIINGNITVSNGQGIIGASGSGYTLTVNGDIFTTNDNGINVSAANVNINVNGRIRAVGGTAAGILMIVGGTVSVLGRAERGEISTTGSNHAINLSAGTIIIKNCLVSASTTRALSTIALCSVTATDCTFLSAGDNAIFLSSLSTTIQEKFVNCYIKTTNANDNAAEVDGGGTAKIFQDCVFIANGTGKSILATGSEVVKIYGTCMANADAEVTDVILQGGNFIVDPTAVYGVSVGTQII